VSACIPHTLVTNKCGASNDLMTKRTIIYRVEILTVHIQLMMMKAAETNTDVYFYLQLA
jgi:hypothetical protein